GANDLVSGSTNTVSSNYSIVSGDNNSITSGNSDAIFGSYNTASADHIATFGDHNIATAPNAIVGGYLDTVSGWRSFAIGFSNNLSGSYSTVSGRSNSVGGSYTAVSGNANTVSAGYALVSGNGNNVSGNYSVVFNNSNSNTSGATTSITGGYQSQTQSNLGLAIGWGDTTSGVSAEAMGRGNYARSYGEMAVGTFATDYTATGTGSFSSADRAFVVGNGTATNSRADAFTVMKSGNVGVGVSAPANKLEVNGNTKTTNLQMTSGAASSYILQSDASGNGSWVAPSTVFANTDSQQLYLNGTNLSIGGGNTVSLSGLTGWSLTGNSGTTPGTNFLGTTNATDLVIKTNNSEAMRVSANGYVGIGTTAPNYQLEVATGTGDYTTAVSILPSTSASSKRAAIKLDDWYVLQDVFGSNYKNFSIYQASSNAQRITIDTNGYVGIGTNGPAAKLDVNGKAKTINFQMTSGATNGYILQSDASGNGTWVNPTSLAPTVTAGTGLSYSGTTLNSVWTQSGNNIYNNNSGFVGIGTTSPGVPVDVQATQNTNEGSYYYLSSGGTGSSSCASCGVSIRASGRIMATEFNATSDRRIKTEIQPVASASALSIADALPVVHYEYIDKPAKGNGSKTGFIAQEVEKAIPSAVKLSSDYIPSVFAASASVKTDAGKLMVTMAKAHGLNAGDEIKLLDASNKAYEVKVSAVNGAESFVVEGWTGGEHRALFVYGKKVNDLHAVDFDQLTAVAIGAVQELNKKTQALEKENEALKSANEKLQSSSTEQQKMMQTMKAQIDAINERLNITTTR
ncbi:MAG: tail fiber domain-containing protein, partial [Bacteroidetes bacterium]|nr:tail fiber domain-containing protein [Bacteroidota bacterium]